MIAWAGYDHLQLSRAISAYYVNVQERLGGRDDPRGVPLLACLIELFPWLKQWHNEVDCEFGVPMGDYFESLVQEEAQPLPHPRPDQGLATAHASHPPFPYLRHPRVGTRSRRRTEGVDSREDQGLAVRLSVEDRNPARGSRRGNHLNYRARSNLG